MDFIEQPEPAIKPEIDGAWHIHCALVRYAAEHPEAASNHYYQDALQEALAGYRFAMGAAE